MIKTPLLLTAVLLSHTAHAFLSPSPTQISASPPPSRRTHSCWRPLHQDATSSASSLDVLDQLKADLIQTCARSSPKASLQEIRSLVDELEIVAEQTAVGQSSALSGLINGEWELLYSPEDATRASPFFWAFRKAFPENADEVFGITDAIPAPLKEIGPAFQQIDFNPTSQTGRFVSRVKVATLGGLATSIMTTRGTILGIEGLDGLRLKIETTKPEDSSVVKTFLGPLGDVVNENAPAFPSGEALERVRPGSSEVILRTTFCDEGLRISRDGDRLDDLYVWRRREFASYEFL
jgi:hypothetical protein